MCEVLKEEGDDLQSMKAAGFMPLQTVVEYQWSRCCD
jgi:hypothetical protein